MNISQPNRLQIVVHQPGADNNNQAVGTQNTTATASTSAAASTSTRSADTNATRTQRRLYMANQLWQRSVGAVLVATTTTGMQRAALRFTNNLPAVNFIGGMTSSLMKAYPLKALENIGPNLKLPNAPEGKLYSKKELLVKIADGLLDGALYMVASVITSHAKNLLNEHNLPPGSKFNDASYADFLRSHPDTLLAINATAAGTDFVHYMLTAALTACVPAAKYQIKSFANQIKDASKHLAFWNNTDQALKSNTEIGVRTVVAAGTTAWLPLSSVLFPSAAKTANIAQSGPVKSAGGSVLRVGQGIAKDLAFNKAKAYRDSRPPQATNESGIDLEAGNAASEPRQNMPRDLSVTASPPSSYHGLSPRELLERRRTNSTLEAGESSGTATKADRLERKLKRKMPEPTFETGESSGTRTESDDRLTLAPDAEALTTLVTLGQAERFAKELGIREQQPSATHAASQESGPTSSDRSDVEALITLVQAEQYAKELGIKEHQPSASRLNETIETANDVEEFYDASNEDEEFHDASDDELPRSAG